MAKKKTKPSSASSVGKRFLRVHAEGAQNIHASDSKFSLDAKPDPYVVFVLNDVTHKCDHVDDVEPIKYFAWPNAVKDFEISQEKMLTDLSLVVHVKDNDTIKDRYIGGTTIPLEPLYAAMQKNVLCQSKMFTLEFADEKFKKKKDSGEIKLTITLVEDKPPPEPFAPPSSTSTADVVESQPSKPLQVQDSTKPIPASQSSTQPNQPTESAKSDPIETKLIPNPDPKIEKEVAAAEPSVKPEPQVSAPPPAEPELTSSSSKIERQSTSTKGEITAIQRQTTKSALQPVATVAASKEGVRIEATALPSVPAAGSIVPDVPSSPVPAACKFIKTLRIELVSGNNLTRPVSLGAIFDRKPDPFVALEFYGMSKTSAALKDVDLKKPVEWKQVVLAFDLPLSITTSFPRKGVSPMDLVIHVKDENLMKPTYMGGTKVSLEEFFRGRDADGEWIGSPTALSGVERTYILNYGDEKLSKRKQCGEITVRFHFTMETPPATIAETLPESMGFEKIKAGPTSTIATVTEPDPAVNVQQVTSEASESPVSVDAPPTSVPAKLSNDVKLLSIEALCGRNLHRPSTETNPKGLLKSLFDRKPDPYVIFVLDGQQKKCPALKDVDIAFFEWRQAVQVFEFSQKPYPKELVVHIRDEDSVGKDPYMAGARIPLDKIWETTALGADSGDAELVKEYPLTFAGENLTKQKLCGEITLRFRWIYAEAPLPVAEERMTQIEGISSQVDDSKEARPVELAKSTTPTIAVAKSHVSYVVLRNLVLLDKDSRIDSSLDLYIVATYFPPAAGQSAKGRASAMTSVINDATKMEGSSSDAKVEWKGEELVLPVIAYDGDTANNFLIELKDKNSITKDTQVAELLLPVQSVIAFNGDQLVDTVLELELCGAKRKSAKSSTGAQTVQFSSKVQFVPLGSPLLENSLSSGIVLTVFLVKGVLKFDTDAEKEKHIQNSIVFGLNVDYLSNQKKRGFLSFGKHGVEAQTDKFRPQGDLSIEWRTCLDIVYSCKQVAAAKDKDSLEVEVQFLQVTGNKAPKAIGSAQLNLWALLNNSSSSSNQLTTTTIRFGENASMDLEFAVAYRSAKDESSTDQKSAKVGEVSAFKSAVHVPNGNLHLLVVKAQNLVSPNPSEEKAEDLDPEVRISIEPKYIKRKENPVRSMFKTRPLENAGVNPTWNEYLRLEYRRPPPPTVAADVPVGKAIEENSAYARSLQMLLPPIIQVGIYDIEVPGERSGSKIIGKAEVPLNAFLLSKVDPSLDTQNAVSMKIDLHLLDKVTGTLYVEGIFEPLNVDKGAESEKQQEMVRTLCRSIGRNLSVKAKHARANADTLSPEVSTQVCLPGRLEIHLVCLRYEDKVTADDRALLAHVWLSSSMEDRKELKSKAENNNCIVEGIEANDVIWDRQATLYAKDICSELLRVEVLTMTGKNVGSIKLPISGIQSYAAGQMARDWHPLVAPVTTAKSSLFSKATPPPVHKAMIGVAFYPDQVLFQPLERASSVIDDTQDSVIVLRCGKLVFGDEARDGSAIANTESTSTVSVKQFEEVACKFALLGDATTGGSATSSFQKQVAARNSYVEWNELLLLELGVSPRIFIQRSLAIGACPILRVEIVVKRKSGRFPEQLTSYELSLVGALSGVEVGKISQLCALYNIDEKGITSFIGVLQIELMTVPTAVFRAHQPESLLRDTVQAHALPGVLCIRFIAGRNLTDVDPNGEQDPYVVAKVAPYFPPSNALANACRTGISMNGGCHPQWNSSVYHLQVRDLRTDFLRIEVIDSNEEDHLADALIGSLSIAAASLFCDEVAPSTRKKGKTKWFETWLSIYPIGNEKSDDISGEIRVDYRFISLDYYLHAENYEDNARGTSPFKLDAQREEPSKAGAGKIYFHIARAKNIPCTKGMQPGVRVACTETGFSRVSKPAVGSIQNPEWVDEIMEMEWPEHDDFLRPSTVVSIEIVDLSVRTANASAMAVITFGFVNFDSFLSHPTAASYYIPKKREKDVRPFQRKQKVDVKGTGGQLHLKILQSRFDIPGFFHRMVMNKRQTLRFQLLTGAHKGENQIEVQEQQLAFPEASISTLVESDGVIDWQVKAAKEDPSVPRHSLLFDCAISSEESGSELLCVNPILICEAALQEHGSKDGSKEILGELEIPIFDFILLDGHLACSWYPISVAAGQLDAFRGSSSKSGAARLGEIKLELQYLPSLTKDKEPKPAPPIDELTILSIQVIEARNLPVSQHQVCVVGVDMLGCSMETMPNPASSTENGNAVQQIVWNEALEFPFSEEKLRTAKDFAVKIQIRDALRNNRVIAFCNWVVPPSVIDCSDTFTANLNQELGENVTLKLELEKADNQLTKKSSGNKSGSEISLVIKRLPMKDPLQLGTIGARSEARSLEVKRVGLLYLRLDSPVPSVQLAASLAPSNAEPSVLLLSFQVFMKQRSSAATEQQQHRWTEIDERGDTTSVIPVYGSGSVDKQKLVICFSQAQTLEDKPTAVAAVGYIQVDSRSLVSAVNSPKTEFVQQMPIQSLSPAVKILQAGGQADQGEVIVGSEVPLRFTYVKRCQGELVLSLVKLESLVAGSTTKVETLFRVELRFHRSKSKWTRSSLGVLNRKTYEIEWRDKQRNPIKLPYSNEFEETEPTLQIVVYRLTGSGEDESGVREAYGQLSLLNLLTDPKAEIGISYPVQVPMITADLSAASRSVLHLELSFIGDTVSFDEKQALEAKVRKATAFLLAEGTAELKRSFAFMGGDEDTPLKISVLKKHLLADNSDEAAKKAREVLQHAADMETDGDLDKLFAAMDVNGDGVLSWDEYADHMQNMHALAHANATNPQLINYETKDVEEIQSDAEQEETNSNVENDAIDEKDDTPQVSIIGSLSNVTKPLDKQQIAELEKVDEYTVSIPVKQVVQSTIASNVDDEPAEVRRMLTKSNVVEPVRKVPNATAVPSRPSAAPQPKKIEKIMKAEPRTPNEPKEHTFSPETSAPVVQKKRYPVLSSYVLDWKVEDVMLWLTSEMELGQYCDTIQKNAVNGKLLLTLSEEELETEIGVVAPLHKRKLMNQIREFQDKFGSPAITQQLASPEKKTRKPQPLETVIYGETPSFIKREQLIYQEKQKATNDSNSRTLKIGGGLESVKVLRATTRLVQPTQPANTASRASDTMGLQSESFVDAMQDIMESVRPHSPPPEEDTPPVQVPQNLSSGVYPLQPIAFPVIQIGSVTNTNELFEIVKQRIQQLNRVLLPLSKEIHETFSDFGDVEDDQSEPEEQNDDKDEKTGLHLVFHAFTSKSKSPKISRAKFQDGLASLLFIDVSWHQFDLLFRRLDVDYDGELSFDEFCDVFQRDHLTFQQDDLRFLEDALVNFAIEKLETQQWTLIELFKAFDRDGGGEISIAEFATLVRFLFTKKDKRRLKSEENESQKRNKRLVYLLMSCLDVSADRRISLQEFLRFFFVMWSSRLMEVQDQLFDCESQADTNTKSRDVIENLRLMKKMMRKALRTNFSRPFRDSMRCVDVNMPSPFTGLLSRLQLLPSQPSQLSSSTNTNSSNQQQQSTQSLQIWQVLQGQTSTSHRDPKSMIALHAETKAKATEESRKRVQRGKNKVLRTRLTRQREPERANAVLQSPSAQINLDGAAKLKNDHRNSKSR